MGIYGFVDDIESVIHVIDVIDMALSKFTGISHVENGITIDDLSGDDYELSHITYNDKT